MVTLAENFKGCEEADPPGMEQARSTERISCAQSVEADMPDLRSGESGSSPGARSNEFRLGQSVLVRSRIELIGLRSSGRGVLYVYDDQFFQQHFGELDALREYARQRFPDAEIHETLLDGFFEIVDDRRSVQAVPRRIGCKATV